MYRYADRNGNVFVLQAEEDAILCYESALLAGAQAIASQRFQKPLTACDYMRLLSAFSLAIDNRIAHCELRNADTSIITATQDGQQRRFMLAPCSPERAELEQLLTDLVGNCWE
jgi:hypothetical protein